MGDFFFLVWDGRGEISTISKSRLNVFYKRFPTMSQHYEVKEEDKEKVYLHAMMFQQKKITI